MSLIVLIVILAIVAMFAVVLLRAVLREIDHQVSRQETATLKSFKQALERSTLRNGTIPGPGGWATAVAAELGADVGEVSQNRRRQPRLLLVDTNGLLQAPDPPLTRVALPYTQTAAGVTNPPQPMNARMMIVSSLGNIPLPPVLTNNYPAAADFASLWNCREGQVPTTGAWAGWTGRPDDVKVERILLDPLFVELRVVTGKSEPEYGLYAIGSTPPVFAAPRQQVANPPRYILRGTILWLYTDAPNGGYLDARQILTKNAFYRYDTGIWKSSAVGADLPGGMDLAAVVKAFLDATPNTNARFGEAQQGLVAESMMDFMRRYVAWGQAGFPDNYMRTELLGIQSGMMDRCRELFMAGGVTDYYPINTGTCE